MATNEDRNDPVAVPHTMTKNTEDHTGPLNSVKGAVCGCVVVALCVIVIIIAVVLTKVERAHLLLQARLATPSGPCPSMDWTTIQPVSNNTDPSQQSCMQYLLGMRYDNVTNTFYNNPGVETRVLSGFHGLVATSATQSLLAYLETLGFVRDVTVRAQPYDWRLTPDHLPNFINSTRAVVESMYVAGNSSKVTLVGHSTGASVVLYFLQHMPQEWKDTHIRSFVALGGNLGGASYCIRDLLTGAALPVGWDTVAWRDAVIRTIPTAVWCLPHSEQVYGALPLVQVGATNYTVNDIPQLLSDLGPAFHTVQQMYSQLRNITDMRVPPNVNTFCWYGSRQLSPWAFHYTASDAASLDAGPYQLVLGDGDGLHDMMTLSACQLWSRQQLMDVGKVVKLRPFAGIQHDELLGASDLQVALGHLLLA